MDYLPTVLIKPVAAAVIVIVGYFFAKIIAALSHKVGTAFSRTIFWSVWLVFVLHAAFEFNLVRESFASFDPRPFKETKTFLMYFATFVLIILIGLHENEKSKESSTSAEKKSEIPDFVENTGLVALLFSIFVASVFPGTFFGNLMASAILLIAGFIVSKIVNEVARSAMDLLRIPSKYRRFPISISPIRSNVGNSPGFDFDAGPEHLFSAPFFIGFAKAAIMVWVGYGG